MNLVMRENGDHIIQRYDLTNMSEKQFRRVITDFIHETRRCKDSEVILVIEE